jgi:hypothetical protein
MSVDFIDRHRQIIPGAQHRAAKFQYLNRRHRYPTHKQSTNLKIELAGEVEENPSTDRFSGIYTSARKLKSNWRGRHITEMLNPRQYLHALVSRDHSRVSLISSKNTYAGCLRGPIRRTDRPRTTGTLPYLWHGKKKQPR